jgi:hypothetical protein
MCMYEAYMCVGAVREIKRTEATDQKERVDVPFK